jgi:hypothetical protein
VDSEHSSAILDCSVVSLLVARGNNLQDIQSIGI